MKSALVSTQKKFQKDTQTSHLPNCMLTSVTSLNLMFKMVFPFSSHRVYRRERRSSEKCFGFHTKGFLKMTHKHLIFHILC